VLATAVCAVVLGIAAGPASAAQLLRNNTFGSFGSGAGQFITPRGVAVDQSNGTIYVADSNQARVDKFNANGQFQEAWGWGVADGNSQFETCTTACQSGQFGNGDGQFGVPTSIAVDSTTHDVYVGDTVYQRVEKFSAAGTFLSTIDGSTSTEGVFQSLAAIAVDQSGNLWTDDSFTGNIDEFNNTGAFVRQWNDNYGTTSNAGIAVDSAHNAVYLISNQSNADKWSLTGTGRTTLTSSFSVTSLAVDPTSGALYAADSPNGNQVEVFDTSGTQTDSFAASGIVQFGGLAIRHSTSQLAISDQANNDVETFGPAVAGPPVVDGESTTNVTRDSATLNAQVNPFGHDTTCTFQYVDDATFQATTWADATTADCSPADLGSSFTDQTATADINGLSHGTVYHFRVVATNGTDTTDGPDQTFSTVADPSIDSETSANVTDTTATLKAQINPNGADATYQFQFGTDTSYSGGTVPAHPVDLGSGSSDATASVDLTGLAPNTTYHFRVVANGTVNGADKTFHTFAGNAPKGLPDGRGIEMVTPVDKDNGEPFVRSGIFSSEQAGNNGNGIAYLSLNALPGSVFDGAFYRATRATSNWNNENVIPPQSTEVGLLCATGGPEMFSYSSDLSKGLLGDGLNSAFGCGADDPPLVAGEPRGAANVFIRDNTNGTYKLVNVTPAGVTPADALPDAVSADYSHVVFDEAAPLTADAPPGQDNLYDYSNGVVKLVPIVGGNPTSGTIAGGPSGSVSNAVSANGSRIYFQANNNLYVRENGATTTQVDAAQGGNGLFMGATADGSSALFTDTVSGDTHLFEWTNGTATDLTPGTTSGVMGVSAFSNDGSYAYFVAAGNLATGATDGQPNLYVIHGGQTRFIATLSQADSCDWQGFCNTARQSSTGAFLAFNSAANQTSFDSNGVNEIYLYDAAAGKLSCASCNPAGSTPTQPTSINVPLTGVLAGSMQYLQRNVSDSGQVFFNSPEQLVPSDNNSHQDIYEYEAGKLSLLSTGTSTDDDFFVDASPSGNDVFFTTSQHLVPQDTDGAQDIYDARVGGGFPFTAPPPACSGEACKPLPTPAPPAPTVATVTFFGSGNVKPSTSVKAKKHKKHKQRKARKSVIVSKRAIRNGAVALRVKVPAAGRITASGPGLTPVSGNVRKAGAVTITVRLAPAARRALADHRKRKLTVTVRYTPRRGIARTATVHLTVGS
jgi:hypothetical protein